MDWDKDRDSFVLLGSAYDGKLETGLNTVAFEPPFTAVELSENETSGLNVLTRWSHSFGVGNDLTLQGYYDRYERNGTPGARGLRKSCRRYRAPAEKARDSRPFEAAQGRAPRIRGGPLEPGAGDPLERGCLALG